MPDSFADVSELETAVGYRPSTPVEEGVKAFVAWYRQYYACQADPLKRSRAIVTACRPNCVHQFLEQRYHMTFG